MTTGFAFTAVTALAAGGSAALLLWTASRLGLPRWVGWSFAAFVFLNPMLFLYGANGQSEGVAAPFLIGAVCFLTLYWKGERLYVGVAESRSPADSSASTRRCPTAPRSSWRWPAASSGASSRRGGSARGDGVPVEGLGLALLLPSLFVGVLWLAVNAAVMKDPLAFTHGRMRVSSRTNGGRKWLAPGPYGQAGDLAGTIGYTAEITSPFLVPIAALLVLRALDGRLRRVNSLSLVVLAFSVPAGMIAPLVYRGLSAGFPRYVMFPLFVAAGWGLFEIATSASRRRAVAVIFAGWVLAAGGVIWLISSPDLAPDSENAVLESVLTGKDAKQLHFNNWVLRARPIARFLEQGPFAEGAIVAADQDRAYAIAYNLPLADLGHLMLTPDRRFKRAIADPRRYGVKYLLVPKPAVVPDDAIVRRGPACGPGRSRASASSPTLRGLGATSSGGSTVFCRRLPNGTVVDDRAALRAPTTNGSGLRVPSLVSVVAPMINEEETINVFYERTSTALAGYRHEIVLVDDGSTDSTPRLLAELAAKDDRVRPVYLSRNFGHQAALTAGLDHARGDAVVSIDADLQDPPELIPKLIDHWRSGSDVVHAVRGLAARRAALEGQGQARVLPRVLPALRGRLPERLGRLPALRSPRARRRPADARAAPVHPRHGRLGRIHPDVGSLRSRPPLRGRDKYPLPKLFTFAVDGIVSFSNVRCNSRRSSEWWFSPSRCCSFRRSWCCG